MKRFLCIGLLIIAAGPIEAQFGWFGGLATEVTQWLNRLQLLAQYNRQLQQLNAALATYYEVVRAGQRLSHMQWSDVETDIMNVAGIIFDAQRIGYDIDTMTRPFTGFANPNNLAATDRYRDWAKTTMGTLQATLQGTGLAWDQLRSERSLRQYLQAQSMSAVGQQQSLQVANTIAIEQMGQNQKLRQLMLADMRSNEAFKMYQVQRDMTSSDFDRQFYGSATVRGDGRTF